jgi:DNA invertase Pin-like site-specific DNA recombinase
MRVALYARVSTGSEEQEQALTQQLDRLRAAAAGHEVTEYIDVMSGTRNDRPRLVAMLAACKRGEVDRVICTRLDRLSRSMAHGAQLLSYFSADDTPSLLALDDSLDLATVGGRLVARMLISLGQAETERLSERVNHGRAFQRRQLIPLGRPPYGYRFTADRKNYELDPETAEDARRLMTLFLEGGQISATLRAAQAMPSCRLTSMAGLRSWLVNPTLIGCRVYGQDDKYRDSEGRLKKRRKKPGDYSEVVPGAHEPLITPLQQAQAVALLAEHANRKRSGLLPGYVLELTKLVHCAHCGRVMGYQHHVRLGPIYLRCTYFTCSAKPKNRIKVQPVKDAIWARLRQAREQLLAVEVGHGLSVERLVEAQRLERQIRELRAMADPELQAAIDRKLQRLDVLLQEQARNEEMEHTPEEIRQALSDERYWELAQNDPQLTRRMFTDYVERVLVHDRAVETVVLRLDKHGDAAAPA